MTIPIKLKNSGVKDKQPNPQTDLQYGEVALNYNNESPALYTRGDDDSLIQLTGDGSAQTPTNLSVGLRAADSMVIESSTGTDVTVPSASNTQAGLLDATDKAKLDAYPVSPGGLQEVTDVGDFTTNDIKVGGTNIDPFINLDSGSGNISAAGNVSAGWVNSTENGVELTDQGTLSVRNDTSDFEAISLYSGGGLSDDKTFSVNTTGAITASGTLQIDHPTDDSEVTLSRDGTLDLYRATTNDNSVIRAYTDIGGTKDLKFEVRSDGLISAAGNIISNQGADVGVSGVILEGNIGQISANRINLYDGYDSNFLVGYGAGDGQPNITIGGSGDITAAGQIECAAAANSYGFKLSGDGADLGGIYRHADGAFIWANNSAGVTQVTLDGRNGNITATGDITAGSIDVTATDITGTQLSNNGIVYAQRVASSNEAVFQGWAGTSKNIELTAGGAVTAAGAVTIGDALTESALLLVPGGGSIFYGYSAGGTTTSRIDADGSITAKGKLSIDVNAGYTTGGEITAGTQSAFTAFSSSSLNTDTQKFVVYEGDTGIIKAAITAGGRGEFTSIKFPDGTIQTTAAGGGSGGTCIARAYLVNDALTASDNISSVTKVNNSTFQFNFTSNAATATYSAVGNVSSNGNGSMLVLDSNGDGPNQTYVQSNSQFQMIACQDNGDLGPSPHKFVSVAVFE